MNEKSKRRLALVPLSTGLGFVLIRVAREWLVGGDPPLWIKLMGSVAILLILGSLIILRTGSNL